MTKVIVDVQSPAYGEAELNVDRVIAVIPKKHKILFESVYWCLDEENFNKFYKVWKSIK